MRVLDPWPRFPDGWELFKQKLSELFRDIAEKLNKSQQGTWTPTTTNTTNVASSSADECFWWRTLDVVSFAGTCTIDPTLGATQTVVELSIPVASNFSDARHARGIAVRGGTGVTNIPAVMFADTTNKTIRISFLCDADAASRGWSFYGSYRVIP